MKQHTLDYSSNIQLHGIVLMGGILFILLFALKYSHAQIEPGNFEFEGENRTYDVYLPNNYSGTIEFPLLIFLHPYGWNGEEGMYYTNFNQVADTSDFLIVYPDAIPDWNSGIGDNPNWPAPNVNDVGFIDALIDTLDYHYNIDLARVYVCGFSNGGFMSYKLACELGHRFAAIASVSGVMSASTLANCEPSNTMPILQIHGTADAVVPINGGASGWYSVEETLNHWINFNNCLQVDTTNLPDLDPTDGCTVVKISYTNCTDSSNILYYKVINGGHTWPGAGPSGLPLGNTNQDINASIEIWNFFKDYPPIHCLPDGITFSTQEEIDNFQTNHPYCTEIEGDVEISGDDITNLGGLNVLTSIGGNFIIGGDTVYPYMGNPFLTSLSGLENLIYINGELKVYFNDTLNSLSGLDNVTQIGGDLAIVGNDALESLTGLNNLTSIAGDVTIGGNSVMFINKGNPNLTSLSALNNLISIGGDLSIAGNGLTSLSGLESLTSIQGSIIIGWGCGMASGFASNPYLESLSGLDNLTSIGGSLQIHHCPVLTSLAGLENLTTISGGLYFGCTALNSLTGLENLNAIGSLVIGSSALTNLSGLDNLTTIAGSLYLGFNSWGGNHSLTNLSGLNNVTSIGGDLVIYDNDSLNNLTALGNLKSLAGDLLIGGNYSSYGNPALISLSGLDNIDAGTIEDIKIRYNSSLSDCDVQSICEYLASPNGTIEIHNNAQGCNSQQEVQDDCDSITSVSEIITEETFTIFPNPLQSTTLIQYTLHKNSPVTLKILDLTGQEIKTLVDDLQKSGEQQLIFNTGDLPSGIYFCVLKTNYGIQIKKIIKL